MATVIPKNKMADRRWPVDFAASPIAIISLLIAIYSFADGSEIGESLRCYIGNSYPLMTNECIEKLPTPQPLLRSRRQVMPVAQISINPNETHFGEPNTQLVFKNPDRDSTYSCMAFVPHKNPVRSRVKRDDPVQYKCDDGTYCSNVEVGVTTVKNVTYDNTQGDVICCRTSKCNSPEALHLVERTLTSVSKCFVGSSAGEIHSSLCPSSSAACLNTTILSMTNYSKYSCDSPSENLCLQHNISRNGCKQVRLLGEETTLCCCFTDGCNYLDENHQSGGPEIGPRPSTPYESLQQFLNLTWVGYLWSGIAVVVLSVVLAVILIRRKKKRCTTVSVVSDLRYQRLTANFNAGDTEDVQMLLADNDA